jgi:hypothetical protein
MRLSCLTVRRRCHHQIKPARLGDVSLQGPADAVGCLFVVGGEEAQEERQVHGERAHGRCSQGRLASAVELQSM